MADPAIYYCFPLNKSFNPPGWMFPSINNGDNLQKFWKKSDSVTKWNYILVLKNLCFRAIQHTSHKNLVLFFGTVNKELRYHLGDVYWQSILQRRKIIISPNNSQLLYFLLHKLGIPPSLKINLWASLVARWLRVCLPMQGTRVRALVWEDPTCRGATGPVRHNYWACASGACAPQQERPRQWEARAPRWGVAPARRNWRKPSRRNGDPTEPKIIISK